MQWGKHYSPIPTEWCTAGTHVSLSQKHCKVLCVSSGNWCPSGKAGVIPLAPAVFGRQWEAESVLNGVGVEQGEDGVGRSGQGGGMIFGDGACWIPTSFPALIRIHGLTRTRHSILLVQDQVDTLCLMGHHLGQGRIRSQKSSARCSRSHVGTAASLHGDWGWLGLPIWVDPDVIRNTDFCNICLFASVY